MPRARPQSLNQISPSGGVLGCRRPEWCRRRVSLRALRTHPGRQNAPRGPDTLAGATRPEPETGGLGSVVEGGRRDLLLSGTIRRDRTCRIFRSASSRSGSVRKPVERYSEASMFRTYEPPELILPIRYGKGELAGWPRQLRSFDREIVHRTISEAGSWEEPAYHSRVGGLEHPRAVRVGLVFPACLL